MRDYTDLQWPEAPFGADQRPFGHHSDMLAAFTLEWAPHEGETLVPVAASAVYLRVRRHGPAQQVNDLTLAIGFRTVAIENPADMPDLLAVLDRALTRARRHAAILAGHRLAKDLARVAGLSATPVRGVVGVLDAWTDRATKQRGMALIVDTQDADRPELDVALDPIPAPLPGDPACCAAVARTALARCLAVGLTAAVHTGRYQWEDTFRVADTLDRVAWDILADTSLGTGPRAAGADTAEQPVTHTGA